MHASPKIITKTAAKKPAKTAGSLLTVSTAWHSAIAQHLTPVVPPASSARVKQALMAWAAAQSSPPPMDSSSKSNIASNLQKLEAGQNIKTRHAFNTNNNANVNGSGSAKWRAINPLVSMQVLHDDGETLSWYARFQPGGHLPAHDHTGNEESLVISGSCYLNDKLMQIGDYQICHAGSRHDKVYSEHGCLLFIRTPKAMLQHPSLSA